MMNVSDQSTTNTFHLVNAPIVEALISISLAEALSKEFLPVLKSCADAIQDQYPVTENLNFQQIEMKMSGSYEGGTWINKDDSRMPEPQIIGYMCKELTNHRVAQFKLDGFTFSELKPYSHWDSFYGEAQKLWNQFSSKVGSCTLGNWVIRYINLITWPESDKAQDYLLVLPELKSEFAGDLISSVYRAQYSINHPAQGVFSRQIFRVPAPEIGQVSYILDHEIVYPGVGLNDQQLWQMITQAREVKNELFKDAVSPRVLEMYR